MNKDRVYSFGPDEVIEEDRRVRLGVVRYPFSCIDLENQLGQPTIVSPEYLLDGYDVFRVELVDTRKEPLKHGTERSLFGNVPPEDERRLCVYMDVNSYARKVKEKYERLRCAFVIGEITLESAPRSVERGIVFDKWKILELKSGATVPRRVPIYPSVLKSSSMKIENGITQINPGG